MRMKRPGITEVIFNNTLYIFCCLFVVVVHAKVFLLLIMVDLIVR